jgi:threonylcarbamoyladenosine tRNA methylthiotransferase MtaB
LARELRPIRIHAFPFSPRPGTVAATLPDQIDRVTSKSRVKILMEIAAENRAEFMQSQIGAMATVLVEDNNIARTAADIPVKISGTPIPNRKICDITITGIDGDIFTA